MNLELKNAEGYYDLTAYEAIKNVSRNEEATNRNIVYICSSLRNDAERNWHKALGYCRFVISQGYIPMSTYLLFPQFMEDCNEAELEKAIDMSLEVLSRCDELWCFGTKLDEKMAAELTFAKKYKIDVKYFTDRCDPTKHEED